LLNRVSAFWQSRCIFSNVSHTAYKAKQALFEVEVPRIRARQLREAIKTNLGPHSPDAGSRFASRRSVPRFSIVASVEISDPIVKLRTSGLVTDISQNGCFLEAVNLPAVNSVVRLEIRNDGSRFEAWAHVVYNRSGTGIGCRFINTEPEQAKLLQIWLKSLQPLSIFP
jgi:hypothetical protein